MDPRVACYALVPTRSRPTTPASASPSGCCSPGTRTRPGPTAASRPSRGLAGRGALRGRQVGPRLRAGRAGARGIHPPAGRRGRRHRARAEHPRAGGAAALGAAAPRPGRGWSPPTASSTPSAGSSTGSPKRAWRSSGSPEAPLEIAGRAARGARWTTAPRWCWSRRSSSTPAASPAGSARWPRAAGATAPRCWWTSTTRSTWCPSRSPTRDSSDAFVVGGGYKYCQLGEGNCFLRIPRDTDLRPVVTGWFSEFTALADRQRPDRVAYGEGGDRFAGATYDPTSHYRAAAVFDFFREQGLTPGAAARGEPASDRPARLGLRRARPRPGGREPRPRLTAERDRRVPGAPLRRRRPRWRGGSTRAGVADRRARRRPPPRPGALPVGPAAPGCDRAAGRGRCGSAR